MIILNEKFSSGNGNEKKIDKSVENKNIDIRGLEISKGKVQECIAKGLTVIEGNAEKDLRQFTDKSFDYVVF